jgi:hypothetical protein
MNKGELYTNLNNQERLILGFTPSREVAFATRGGNTNNDYDRCQIQPIDTFNQQARFSKNVTPTELARVLNKFASYINAYSIR